MYIECLDRHISNNQVDIDNTIHNNSHVKRYWLAYVAELYIYIWIGVGGILQSAINICLSFIGENPFPKEKKKQHTHIFFTCHHHIGILSWYRFYSIFCSPFVLHEPVFVAWDEVWVKVCPFNFNRFPGLHKIS